MSNDYRSKWTIKDCDDCIILSGGILGTGAEVIRKAEDLLGHSVSNDYVKILRRKIKHDYTFTHYLRYYYLIDYHASNDSDSMDAYIHKDKSKSYYKIDTHNKIIHILVSFLPMIITLLLSFMTIISAIVNNAGMASILIKALFAFIIFMPFASLIKGSSLNYNSVSSKVKNGEVYIANDDNEIYNKLNKKIINKLLRHIKRKFKKNNSDFKINTKHVVINDNDHAIMNVDCPGINKHVEYDAENFIKAFTCAEESKELPAGNIHKSIETGSIERMHELSHAIRELEYKVLASNAIANAAEESVNEFVNLRDASPDSSITIIRRLESLLGRLKVIDANNSVMDNAVSELDSLIDMQKELRR